MNQVITSIPIRNDHLIIGAPPYRCTVLSARLAQLFDTTVQTEPSIPDSYRSALKEPRHTAHHNILRGRSCVFEPSVIDWWTYTSKETRSTITDRLIDTFIKNNGLDLIKNQNDLVPALDLVLYPIGRHGLDHLVAEPLWQQIRSDHRETLSQATQRTLENIQNGADLEHWFKQYCATNGLKVTKESAKAFSKAFPNRAATVREQVNGFSGIPDFFVDKTNTTTLHRFLNTNVPRWRPKNRYGFVECKYNTSRLSKNQREMVAALQDHGIESWLLRESAGKRTFTLLQPSQ